MIYHLNGRLIEKHPTHVVIECGGVGYFVSISLTTFEALTSEESIFLNIHMVVREESESGQIDPKGRQRDCNIVRQMVYTRQIQSRFHP